MQRHLAVVVTGLCFLIAGAHPVELQAQRAPVPPEERAFYNQAVAVQDPAQRVQAIEGFLKQYPKSSLRVYLYQRMVSALFSLDDYSGIMRSVDGYLAIDRAEIHSMWTATQSQWSQAQTDNNLYTMRFNYAVAFVNGRVKKGFTPDEALARRASGYFRQALELQNSAFAARAAKPGASSADLRVVRERETGTLKRALDEAALFTVQDLYTGRGLHPEDVRQGGLGSCYFHAAVSALAGVRPDFIRGIIRQKGDGTYTVKFADGKTETAYFTDIQMARISGYDRSEGLWVAVLFRAYAQKVLRQTLIKSLASEAILNQYVKEYLGEAAVKFLGESAVIPVARKQVVDLIETNDWLILAYDRAIRGVVDQHGEIEQDKLRANLVANLKDVPAPDALKEVVVSFLKNRELMDSLTAMVKENGELFGAYRAVGHGGLSMRVFKALAGSGKFTRYEVTEGGRVAQLLADAVQKRLPLVTSTRRDAQGNPVAPPNSKAWFVASHAYTVLGYDAASQTVKIRNPWGSNPLPNGIFTLPLSVFLQGFYTLEYASMN